MPPTLPQYDKESKCARETLVLALQLLVEALKKIVETASASIETYSSWRLLIVIHERRIVTQSQNEHLLDDLRLWFDQNAVAHT